MLQATWWKDYHELEEYYEEKCHLQRKVGNFTYHFSLLNRYPDKLRPFIKLFFYLWYGYKLKRTNKHYDYIVCYGTNTTGLAAVVLKLITKADLITEIPGVPRSAALHDTNKVGLKSYIYNRASSFLLRIVLRHTDILKLLYTDQVDPSYISQKTKIAVFHDYVPTERIVRTFEPRDDRFILLLGSPWYLKGADILIKAFHKIKHLVPNHSLKIVGWFPDKEPLELLSNYENRIEISGPVQAMQAYSLISRCSVLVLPSRTEGMGRVLLEAMALRKPTIGSRVDGIPAYIKHDFNGLLFESGDHDQLAECILKVLGDPILAQRMGDNGFLILNERLSNQIFIEKFKLMIETGT